MSGVHAGVSVLAGGVVAWVNIGLLLWRNSRSQRQVSNASNTLVLLYRSSLERFIVVALLFGGCIGVLELEALPLLGGFIVGQTGLFGLSQKRRVK